MEGWVRLHRKISDNPLWKCEPFTRGQAWVDLFLLASFQKTFFYVRGIKINLDRGQLAWSETKLSERWQWSRTKLRKFLKELEKEQQIIQQKGNVIQVITIVNYEEYQKKEQQSGQQKDNRKTTEKHIQEYKELIIMFNNITGRDFKGTEKSKSQFNARFNDGFTLDNFKTAITNCFNDEWHRNNPKYLTPEFITRSEKLQQYLNIKKQSSTSRKKW